MSKIGEYIDKLKHIKQTIKSKKEEVKQLVASQKQLEEQIILYLKDKDLPGIRHNGNVLILDEKPKKKQLPKKDQQNRLRQILQENNISNPDNILTELQRAITSIEQEQTKLKFL